MVIKVTYQPEAIRPWSYPPRVLEEAIANCIYHRDYQRYDPVRVFIHPDRIIFQNGGGPDRALRPEDFQTGRIQPRHYRNRRLGSFLKALDLTEGYATGIRLMLDEMAHNGSAPPVFSMDDDRTYFAVEFQLHPAFTESQRTPEKTQNGTIPGLKIVSDIDFESLQKIFKDVFEQLAKREREEDRIKILALHPLSIHLLLNLSNQKTMNRRMLLESIEVTNQTKNAERYLAPLLELSAIEPTIKDRPQSPQQRYRLTEKGQRWVNQLNDFSSG
jgi:ATP-dependent DNA helicase RecG